MLAGASSCPPGVLPSTSVDCYNAQSSVDTMNQTFLSLGSPSKYAASVSSITQSLADAMPTIAVIGFCDAAHSIGCEADTLTNQMLTDSGQAPISATPGTEPLQNFDISSIFGTPLLIIGGIVLFAWLYATKK